MRKEYTLRSQEAVKHKIISPDDMPAIAYAESGVIDKPVDIEAALVVPAKRQASVNREETRHKTKINHPPKHCTVVLINDPTPGKIGDPKYNTHAIVDLYYACYQPRCSSVGLLG